MNLLDRHLESIFCDDIRYETNGKLTFVGVYTGAMIVSQFPAHLPKLCVVVKAVALKAEAFKSISFKVTLNDVVLADTPPENLESSPNDLVSSDPSRQVSTFQCLMTFSPLLVETPSILRIRAIDENGKEYAATGLLIGLAQPDEPDQSDEASLKSG